MEQGTAPAALSAGPMRRSGTPTPVLLLAMVVAAAVLLPPVYLVVRTAGAGADAWALVANGRTATILARTLVLVCIVTAVATAIAVPIAWLTVRTDLPLRRPLAVVTALPLVVPSYVYAFAVVVALGPRGMVRDWLAPLGVERLPEIYGLPGAALTLSLMTFPYVLLPVRAAMARLDPSLEDAARGLGRGALRTFTRVTLPLLRPAIVAGALLVALYTLTDFGAVSLLRYQTFTWAIYVQYESAFDRTVAAALSLVLVVLTVGIVVGEVTSRGRARHYRVTPGGQRRTQPARLGAWRWAAFAFVGGVALVSLAAPLGVLGYWLARGVSGGEAFGVLLGPARNSLYVSGLAAVTAAAASVPVALVAARRSGWLGVGLERVTYLSFGLPGVAVALAFVFFATSAALFLYQTIALLVLAYTVLFVPAAVGATQAALRQVSPRLEEAARGLGATPWQAFRRVTLPLTSRGVLAGAVLVFLLTMKELPATLILAPVGFTSLATSIWNAASEAFFARAAAGALLLILVASLPMAFIVARERD